jgi:hypothetical protein
MQGGNAAFYKSIKLGHESDWQPLVELCMDHADIDFNH